MRIFTVVAAVAMLAGTAHTGPDAFTLAHAQGAHGPTGAPPADATTPEEKMRRRFPQPVRVGALIGARVLDEDDVTLGRVRDVVKRPDGKILLVVSYGGWLGWGARPVAIPVETVALIGKNVAALDITPKEIANLPEWSGKAAQPIGTDEIIRLAISRR